MKLKKYELTFERRQKGKVIGNYSIEVETSIPPRLGDGRTLLIDPPIHETITEIKEIQ